MDVVDQSCDAHEDVYRDDDAPDDLLHPPVRQAEDGQRKARLGPDGGTNREDTGGGDDRNDTQDVEKADVPRMCTVLPVDDSVGEQAAFDGKGNLFYH